MHIAFMPLLVLLLPRRVETLFGASATTTLSWLLLIGAVTASTANIVAGHLGDQWLRKYGNRRGLIAIGLTVLIFSFLPLALANEPTSLTMAIIAFQIGLNLAFSPAMAVLTDHIPIAQKGKIAGLIGAALPLSALGTTLVGWAFPVDTDLAFFASAAFVLICVAPLLVRWGFESVRQSDASRDFGMRRHSSASFRSLALLWFAKLLVQLSASFVLLYLFLHIAGLIAYNPAWQGESATQTISIISLLAASVSVPTAVFAGRLSDRLIARQTIMIGAVLLLSLSLLLLGSNPAPLTFGIAFIFFQVGLTAYLSVDAALVAQLISHHPRRGRILGIMNLTNTLPAIMAPLVTLKLLIVVEREMPYNMIHIISAAGLLAAIAAVQRSRLI
jgi:MFS family permease